MGASSLEIVLLLVVVLYPRTKTFEENLLEFRQRLKARGYTENIIQSSLSGVYFGSRHLALKKLPFVIPYHSVVKI